MSDERSDYYDLLRMVEELGDELMILDPEHELNRLYGALLKGEERTKELHAEFDERFVKEGATQMIIMIRFRDALHEAVDQAKNNISA